MGQRTHWNEKIANGGSQIQQAAWAKGLHEAGNAPQLMQIVRDAHKRQHKQHVAVARIAVRAQDIQHLSRFVVPGHDAAVGPFAQEVEEAVGCMAVVSRERKEGELAVSGAS